MTLHPGRRRRADLLQGLGCRAAGAAQPRLAAAVRQLGGADALPGRQRVSGDRPRSRGHGRSTQTWTATTWTPTPTTWPPDRHAGSDTPALVGFSTGGGEVARYVGRHGTGRVAKVVLVSAVPPFMLQTAGQSRRRADRGVRRDPGRRRWPTVRRPTRIWPTGRSSAATGPAQQPVPRDPGRVLVAGHAVRPPQRPECITAFSATDFRPDLDKIDVPTLVIHGDDDQVVPFEVGGKASAARIKGAELRSTRGAPHGITDTAQGTTVAQTSSTSSILVTTDRSTAMSIETAPHPTPSS